MESHTATIRGEKGDLVCWLATWTDVAKFFLLNYVLHAFTVLYPPGASTLLIILDTSLAMVLPLSGSGWAMYAITMFAIGEKDKLKRAARAGALCMVVPDHFKG